MDQRVSMNLDSELWRRAGIIAAQYATTKREVTEQALRLYMQLVEERGELIREDAEMTEQVRYSVIVQSPLGELIADRNNLTQEQAEKLAPEIATKYPDDKVFIEWFRPSDGQHGYLNPSGDHDIVGEAW